jgi:hypothetical protein
MMRLSREERAIVSTYLLCLTVHANANHPSPEYVEAAHMLICNGADVRVSMAGVTMLHVAMTYRPTTDRERLITMLLQFGADPTALTTRQWNQWPEGTSVADMGDDAARSLLVPRRAVGSQALCMQCRDVPSTMLFTGCGHLCMCNDCYRTWDDGSEHVRCYYCNAHTTAVRAEVVF